MNITIIGAGSTTAKALYPMLLEETDDHLHLLSSGEINVEHPRVSADRVDVTDRVALKEAMMTRMPDAIINTAAMTNVDACELEKKLAWTLNVIVVEHLIRLSRMADAHLIHFSTDYVFNGEDGPYTEQGLPSPINYYGKTKLASENALATAGIDHTVIRTNVVYGPQHGRPDFVGWVLNSLEKGQEISVVTDQMSNPTYVDDLSESVIRILQRHRTGSFHVAGATYLSRFEFAKAIAEFFVLDADLIKPVTTEALDQPALRPLKGGLVTLKAESDLRMRFRSIESGLVSIRHDLLGRGVVPLPRTSP